MSTILFCSVQLLLKIVSRHPFWKNLVMSEANINILEIVKNNKSEKEKRVKKIY